MRSRSGIQPSSTTSATSMLTMPMGMPVWSDMPWCSTSHGSSPRSARTMQAKAMPHSTSPIEQPGEPSPDLGPRWDRRTGATRR